MNQNEELQQLRQNYGSKSQNLKDLTYNNFENEILIENSNQKQLQKNVPHQKMNILKAISLCLLATVIMFMLSYLAKEITFYFQKQCKIEDLIDGKVSLQNCQGKLYQMRKQNIIRSKLVNEYDHYDFKASMDQIIQASPFDKMDKLQEEAAQITIEQSLRAIRLMGVVHNVNYKGEFVFDHFDFYQSPEEKAKALLKILQSEKQYFDKKYEINKYAHDQIGICVYVPSYNNAKNRLYLRNLDSIFQQEYQNYHLVYINDASKDGTGDYVKMYMEENEIPAEKYEIINNEKNKGNCANVYNAGNNYCKEGEIMVFLDGDDALIGRQVFSLLNAVYQKEKVALTYGQFIVIRNSFTFQGFSRPIPSDLLSNGKFRQNHKFYSSHLKTMSVDLFRKIKQSDLQYDNGTFLDTASDVAYMTTAIQLSGSRLKFLKQINYEYRFDTGLNDMHLKQILAQDFIYKKRPSKVLQNFTFIDNLKTVHYI